MKVIQTYICPWEELYLDAAIVIISKSLNNSLNWINSIQTVHDLNQMYSIDSHSLFLLV